MRIIAGSARGRVLQSPRGDRTRPTADRVRESVFAQLTPHLADARVLDLFAGAGGLGLEALSRGAREAVFVDSSRTSFAALRCNVESLGFASQSRLYHTHFAVALRQLAKGNELFDIIFLDPPYHEGLYAQALAGCQAILAPGGCTVIEFDRMAQPELPPPWTTADLRRYGNVGVIFALLKEQ